MSLKLLKSSLLVVALSNLGNFLNYAFQVLLGRSLTSEDFGVFTSVNSLGAILAVGAQMLPFISSKLLAINDPTQSQFTTFLNRWNRILFKGGGLLIIILLALSPLMSRFLSLPSTAPLILYLLGLYFFPIFVLNNSVLIAMGNYFEAHFMGCLFSALRVGLVALALHTIGTGSNGVLALILLANICMMLLQMRVTRRNIGKLPFRSDHSVPEENPKDFKFLGPLFLTWLLVGILTNIDVVLVKHFFDPHIAGLYAKGTIVARIGIFLPQTLVTVLVPEITKNDRAGKSSRNTITQVLCLGAGLSFLFAFFASLFSETAIKILLGVGNTSAAVYLSAICWAMATISTLNLVLNALIAKSSFAVLKTSYSCLTFGLILTFLFFHHSPQQIAYMLLAICLAILAWISFPLFFGRKP